MLIIKTSPVSIFISIMVMSGVLTHTAQVEHLAQTNTHKGERLTSSHHTHVEISSYGGSTFSVRTQPPASRPQDDDDKDSVLKRRANGDGFGNANSNSSWAI